MYDKLKFDAATPLLIDKSQRMRLEVPAQSGKTPKKVALRARIVLKTAEGIPNNRIAAELGISRPTVLLWRQRFGSAGVPGIMKDAKRPGRKKAISEALIKEIVEKTLYTVSQGATHWSTRSLAKDVGVSHLWVYRN
jgi:transposase